MKPTKALVREFLDYDPPTGVLRWKQRQRKWFSSKRACSIWNALYAGKVAGSVALNGYWCVGRRSARTTT
jgi:hypothetical protein